MKRILIILCFVSLSISAIHAQDVKVRSVYDQNPKVVIGLKDSIKPEIYIDGVKYDHKIFDLLDPEKISSINVLKGEVAIKEYNAPNGVILITSKNADKKTDASTGIKIRSTDSNSEKVPVIVIDGKVANQGELGKLSPSDIQSITVLKGDDAMKLYKSSTGVIVVKTK